MQAAPQARLVTLTMLRHEVNIGSRVMYRGVNTGK